MGNTTKAPYTYEELTFARTMRDVACSIRKQRAPMHAEGDEEGRLAREKWLSQNPVETFYSEIVTNVLDAADHIREIIRRREG